MADIFADPMTLRGLVAVGAYLLGAIPFGLLLTKAAGLGDVRRIGSGNIGATNVLRTGRKGLAAATLLLDVLKGAAAVLIAKWLNPADDMLPVVAGLAAFLGHLYPLWLKFKGGKGVATAAGVLLAWSWPMALMLIAVWVISLWVSRISSFAGLSAAAVAPLLMWAAGRPDLVAPTIALSLLIIWRHKANIARLLKGEEPKIGGDKKG